MKYLFPSQFGMHNVFTCTVDSKESTQPFKDYTLREQEIAQLESQAIRKGNAGTSSVAIKQRVPKRLRGEALDLVRKLQKLHSRCSYYHLLKHYCPLKVSRALRCPANAALMTSNSEQAPVPSGRLLLNERHGRLNSSPLKFQILCGAPTLMTPCLKFERSLLRHLWFC